MKDIKGNTVEFDFSVSKIGEHEPVFIGKVDLSAPDVMAKIGTKTPRELCLFGGREHDTEYRFLSYIIQEKRVSNGEMQEHYLVKKDRSSVYSERDEVLDEVAADMVKRKDCPCVKRYPSWRISEMNWPTTADDELFVFVERFYVPDNELNNHSLYDNSNVYLFVHSSEEDKMSFGVLDQDAGSQSIQDHYKFEEAMIEYENNKNNPEIVEKLVKRKLKDFQLYLLDQSDLRADVLELIAEHGKTKAIKNEALARLKESK